MWIISCSAARSYKCSHTWECSCRARAARLEQLEVVKASHFHSPLRGSAAPPTGDLHVTKACLRPLTSTLIHPSILITPSLSESFQSRPSSFGWQLYFHKSERWRLLEGQTSRKDSQQTSTWIKKTTSFYKTMISNFQLICCLPKAQAVGILHVISSQNNCLFVFCWRTSR